MLKQSWRFYWCRNRYFASVPISPSKRVGAPSQFSRCFYYLDPFYPSWCGLLSFCQGSCNVVEYCINWPFLVHMSLGCHLWLLFNVVGDGKSMSLPYMHGRIPCNCPVNAGLRYTEVLIPCSVRDDSTSSNAELLFCLFSIVKFISVSLYHSSYSWTSVSWIHVMKVTSKYLRHGVDFINFDSNVISSKYSMCMLAIASDNGKPIVKLSPCRLPFRIMVFL